MLEGQKSVMAATTPPPRIQHTQCKNSSTVEQGKQNTKASCLPVALHTPGIGDTQTLQVEPSL